MEVQNDKGVKPIKLVYLIGTYPGLTNTFIDREITTLRQLGNFQIQIVSIRYPRTLDSCSPEQKKFCQETLYLIPPKWNKFNYFAFLLANLYFISSRPRLYVGTLIDFLTRGHAGIKAWLMALVYFWQGVYTAYLLRQSEFHHIHVHFMDRAVLVALVVSRFLGKSYSFTAHAADIYTKKVLVREKIDHARFIVTVSQYNKQHMLETHPGIDADKIHILHPWVDLSIFTPCANRSAHEHFNILSVGRLVEKKGHEDLIKAISIIQGQGVDAVCRIVGEGPLHAELEKQIAEKALQDRVQLLGGLSQSQVMRLLREWADVFVLPCVIAKNGDRDGIPVSLAEAMAMELPVVSTDIVGIPELVQPGTGILVPPHNPPAIAAALRVIASQDQATNAVMGRKAREIVDSEFNLHTGTQDLAGYFMQALRQHTLVGKE